MQAVEQRIYLHIDEQIIAFRNYVEQQPEGFVLITERGPDSGRASHGKTRRIGRALQLFEHSQRLLSPSHPGIDEREIRDVGSFADIIATRRLFFQTTYRIHIRTSLEESRGEAPRYTV